MKFIEEQKDKNYTLTVSLNLPEKDFNKLDEMMQTGFFEDYGDLVAQSLNFYISVLKVRQSEEAEGVVRYEIGADGEGRVAIVEKG